MARSRHGRFRLSAWIAIWAIWVQALLPIAHHPASLAMGQYLADTGHNLCLSSTGSPANPDKGPVHKLPACPICQAAHAIGGFVPPDLTELDLPLRYAIVSAVLLDVPVPRRLARIAAQPRGPPSPV
jgi:Protein of unknown function (DUF2946)